MNLLGEVTARDATKATSAAASVAAAAATGGSASLLVTLGVSAQAVPVIGNIAGAVLLVTGYIIAAQQKAKAVKSKVASAGEQALAYRAQLTELDAQVLQAQKSKQNIVADLTKLGINPGLSGFSDWLKKTFTPVAYQNTLLATANAEVATLEAQVQQRIDYLKAIETELNDLYDKLTYGKIKRAALWTLGIAALITAGYYVNKELKIIKI